MSLILISVLFYSSVASAEVQSGSTVILARTLSYKLDCDFSLFGNDRAVATTSWTSKKGYKVETRLAQCQTSAGNYKRIGVSLNATSAVVTGSVAGVWRFRSRHYTYDNKTAVYTKRQEYSDW